MFCKVLDKYYCLFYHMEDHLLLHADNQVEMFCLQFTFCPRINRELLLWAAAHNNQGVRTEHFKTPSHMWLTSLMQERCSVQANRGSAAVSNAFDFNLEDHVEEISNTYDINILEDISIIPTFPCPLSQAALHELQITVDLLQHSESHGLDI